MHEVENRSSEEPGEYPLRITRHAQARGQQRGYLHGDMALVYDYGTLTEDGVLLTDKDVRRVRAEVKRFLRRLERLAGTMIVVRENAAVTVYRPRTAQRRRRMLRFGRERRNARHRRRCGDPPRSRPPEVEPRLR